MSFLGNLVLTGTSLAPVLFVYAALAFFEKEILGGAILTAVGIGAFASGIALVTYFKRNLVPLPLTFRSVEVADKETIGILVLYLLPLLRTSFANLDIVLVIPAVAIFFSLTLTGYNYHFSPLLALLGWKFYKVSTPEGVSYVVVTKKNLRGMTEDFTVGQLTGYTVIDLES